MTTSSAHPMKSNRTATPIVRHISILVVAGIRKGHPGLLLLFLFGAVTNAGTPFFYDEFDRDSLFDGEFDWSEEYTTEDHELRNGNLIISPTDDDRNSNASVATSKVVGDFIARTQIRFDENSVPSQNPWIGIFGRDTDMDGVGNGFWGGPATNGVIFGGSTIGDNSNIIEQRRALSFPDIVENDVHIEYVAIGDQVAITSWIDGTEKPKSPQVSFQQEFSDSGLAFAITYNPPSSTLDPVSIRYFAVLPAVRGDFSANDLLDVEDIDLLTDALRGSTSNRAYDLNSDAIVTSDDRRILIEEVFSTYFGDSNLDGEFNSGDFVQVFRAGEYEDAIDHNSTWSTGDWNGDGDFNSSDFVLAFQAGGYEKGPRTAFVTVPEPTNLLALYVLLAIALRVLQRRHGHWCLHKMEATHFTLPREGQKRACEFLGGDAWQFESATKRNQPLPEGSFLAIDPPKGG